MSKELAPKQATPLAKAIPAGFEEPTQQENIIIPRVKIIQSTSPEAKDKELKHIKMGMIINSLTKDEVPPTFVPIFMYTKWFKFNPRQMTDPNFDKAYAPGALIYSTTNPEDPMVATEGQFGKDGSRPLLMKTLNYFSWFPGADMPVILNFSNTSLRAGKELYTLAKLSQKDMFAKSYTLSTELKENDKGSFYVYKVRPAGNAPEDVYALCRKLYESFSPQRQKLEAHDELQDSL